jgi:hypothetical protein
MKKKTYIAYLQEHSGVTQVHRITIHAYDVRDARIKASVYFEVDPIDVEVEIVEPEKSWYVTSMLLSMIP